MTTPNPKEMTTFRVSVDTDDVNAFLQAMAHAEYSAVDTGERVTTDDGLDAEAVLLVTVPSEAVRSRSDRVAALLAP